MIDWEFTYVALAEFTFAPPWWLLFEQPEYWVGGLDHLASSFSYVLEKFMRALRRREDTASADDGWQTEEQRLSSRMSESWESGEFWTVYATRKGFALDFIYWHKLDQKFFGPVDATPEEAGRGGCIC